LTQKRFLYDNLLESGAADSTQWQAPVTIGQAGSDKKTSFLMTDPTASVALSGADSWIKVNAGQTAFFRVNYPVDEWERLKEGVTSLSLPPTDRLGLQNDAYALVRAGYLPATSFLSLIEAFANEENAPVWGDVAASLRGLEALLLDTPYLDAYRSFARGLYTKIVEKVGWDAKPGEGHLDSLLRSTVIGQHGGLGGETTLAEARRRFERYLADPESLHPDLRAVTFGLVAQQGGRSEYDTLWEMEKKARLHEEKMRILGALTRFQDQGLLRELLDRSLTDEVRSQDVPLVIVSTAGNSKGRDLTWEFMKEHWDELDRRYGKGGFAIMRLVSITGGFTTPDREREVDEFFKTHPAPSAARTIQQALERIRLNVKWLEKNRDAVGEWLQTRG
ncbi:MAG: ERAP1-like C-terminal domain-containing protein, partial [Dehalococcoidia bacterium]